MSVPRAVLLASLLAMSAVSQVSAHTLDRGIHPAHQGTIMRTFTLRVLGRPDPHSTFWVAFGPLDNQFGMLRLRRRANTSVYQVRTFVPAHGRTVFAYLAGQGVVHSKAGDGPGDPVVMIAQVGPVSVSHASLHAVTWFPPVG